MLQNVNDIAKRVGALLDDPANTRYTIPYLIPLIDQEFDEMDVALEKLGMQYIEHIATVDVGAQTTDLTYLLADGQALSTMKAPSRLKWKLQGLPDTSYVDSAYVDELDEVAPDSEGALQWTFQQGALQVTPSATALTLKIYFDAVSTDIYDPAQSVVRGTAHVLAMRVAAFVASLQNGMGTLQKKLDAKAAKEWREFCQMVTLKQQSKQRVVAPLHPRRWPQGNPTITAPPS